MVYCTLDLRNEYSRRQLCSLKSIHTDQGFDIPSVTGAFKLSSPGDFETPEQTEQPECGAVAPGQADIPVGCEHTHPLGATVTVEEDGRGALVHLMASVPSRVVHLQQAILVCQLLSKETCSERT